MENNNISKETVQQWIRENFSFQLIDDQKFEEKIKEIEQIVNSEKIEPTTALNILINAVQTTFDSEYFNDLDKFLIAKALECFKSYVDAGENFVIKVKED